MRNYQKLTVAALLLTVASPSLVLAQRPQNPTSGIYGPVIPVQSGNYKFVQLDQNGVLKDILGQTNKIQEQDLQAAKDMIAGLNNNFKDLVAFIYGGADSQGNTLPGLKIRGQKTSINMLDLNNKIEINEFLEIKNEFEQRSTLFSNNIATFDSIVDVLVNAKTTKIELTDVQLGELRKNFQGLNFSKFKAHYAEQLAKINSDVASFTFGLKMPGTAPAYKQVGLVNIDELIAKNPYSEDDFRNMQKESLKIRSKITDEQLAIDQTLNAVTFKQIRTVIDQFGVSDSYRYNQNFQGREDAIKQLEEAFYVRSALRMIYGISLGAFQINYDKKALNLDYLFMKSKISWKTNMVTRNQSELTAQQDLLFQAFDNMSKRNLTGATDKKDPYDMKQILAPGKTMFSRASTVVAFLKGKTNEVSINVVVLGLLLADVQEELMLAGSGGHPAIKKSYTSRYKLTGGWEDAKAAYFGDAEERTPEQLSANANTLMGAVNHTTLALDSISEKLRRGQELLKTLEDLKKKSPYYQKLAARKSEL